MIHTNISSLFENEKKPLITLKHVICNAIFREVYVLCNLSGRMYTIPQELWVLHMNTSVPFTGIFSLKFEAIKLNSL